MQRILYIHAEDDADKLNTQAFSNRVYILSSNAYWQRISVGFPGNIKL